MPTTDRGWSDLAAVVLAAGEGLRLRPLTAHRPKALCPVANVPLLDRALARLSHLGVAGPDKVAVNACWLGDQVGHHVGRRVHLSVEAPDPLGTAGGVAHLRDWVAGRDVVVCNADAYLGPRDWADPTDVAVADRALKDLVDGWDRQQVRLLVVPADARPEFGQNRFAGMSLLPWRYVAALDAAPGELVTAVWRPAEAAGELDLHRYPGVFVDCGTPADYLAANLHASGGVSVVGKDAVVRGHLTRSVVWPGGYVGPDEHLVDAIRVGSDVTVSVSGRGVT